MSVITYTTALGISRMAWALPRRDIAFSSPFGSQSVEVNVPLWEVSITGPSRNDANMGPWKAFLMKLRGKTNQFEVWDVKRPAPLGTMRGTMTLNAEAAQGATTLAIVASGENAKTLVEGDLLGLGSGTTQQVVMVTADATSNGSGVISVSVEPPLRNTHAAAAAVTWDKPKALFRATQSRFGWEYTGGSMVKMDVLNLIEDWRA